ncbi:hypothetical protein ACIBQ0_17305 [Nocardia nova]|uniref:phage fiber-tail adaptor protein n=1 Tax=Nocardia nova TaxID=37330 RepID=UPI0037AE40DB
MPYPIKIKDPEAVLDYLFRWGPDPRTSRPPWLEDTETITTHTITVPDGITLENSEITPDGKNVLVWLSGGTVGITYSVECRITTTMSRTDVRRMDVFVQLK